MDFESINKHPKAKYDSSLGRDKSMVINKQNKNESTRITQIINDFKRSTLSTNVQKEHSGGGSMIAQMSNITKDVRFNNSTFVVNSKLNQQSAPSRRKSLLRVAFDKNKDIDYEQGTLMSFIEEYEDPFSGHIILQTFKFIHLMLENVASNVHLHLPLAKSGLVWKLLLHLLDDHKGWDLQIILDPTAIERSICTTLRLFFSH